uniref:3'-5' exonuclease domain-containing protein n=1 Tax=Scleropages formosus TaxID=113540 RepID=A0A8C9S7U7_SCLFO
MIMGMYGNIHSSVPSMFCAVMIIGVDCDSGNGGSDHGVQGAELTVAEFQPYRNNMELGDDDDESECVDFVVIDTFSEKFRPAVMHIYKQKVISIAADSIGDVPHERLCWLQIATNNKVYLFDILLLGAKAFKNGLSMTLENKHILKVVHDCRSMAACLLTQYGVSLANVFDTQVADVAHFYMETGGFLPDRVSTLQEVVALHLEVPLSRLEALNLMSEISKENKKVWHVRPCPLSLLKMMVFSVIYLQPLRLVLLDGLMSDITSLMDSYLEISLQEMVPTQHIGSSNRLALPSELRRLEQKKQERRQRAVDMYPLTADGLLLRFSPKPLKDPIFQADLNTPLPATAVQPAAQMVPSSVSSLPRTIPAGNPVINFQEEGRRCRNQLWLTGAFAKVGGLSPCTK